MKLRFGKVTKSKAQVRRLLILLEQGNHHRRPQQLAQLPREFVSRLLPTQQKRRCHRVAE